MNRAQRRKAARTPMDAKTLKRIVDDAVENTKGAAFLLFKLALAKEGIDSGADRQDILNHLDKMEQLIDELQTDEAKRNEIIKFLKSEEGA